MSIWVLLAVLGAAFLHALWNALIKVGASRVGAMVILSVAEVPIGLAVALPRAPINLTRLAGIALVLGGVILASIPELLRHVVEPAQQALFGKVVIEAEVLRQLLYGLAMVLIMLHRPAGLWPSPKSEDRPDHDVDQPNKSTDVVSA